MVCKVLRYEFNTLYNEDCLQAMKTFPDNYFDLAIVDPPYFSGPNTRKYYGKEVNNLNIKRKDYPVIKDWTLPNSEYFDELIRISRNQIIWGVNYFDYHFGPGRIIWDKVNYASSFSNAEIAYCSLQNSVRTFRYMWNGMMQGKSIIEGHIMQGDKSKNEYRIHPTQKPVNLYIWLLQKYAKKGDLILDTHVGSASSLIACHRLGFEYIGFELDSTIYELASERLNNEMMQMRLEF